MFKKAALIGCLCLGVTMFTTSCVLKVDNPKPTVAYVHFLNTHSETVSGLAIHFQVRNLSGLGQSWPDVVAYGSQSALMEVTPHSGDFTVTGEIAATGGAWTSGSWPFTENINAGDTVLTTLD
jgi:hypothetical protein